MGRTCRCRFWRRAVGEGDDRPERVGDRAPLAGGQTQPGELALGFRNLTNHIAGSMLETGEFRSQPHLDCGEPLDLAARKVVGYSDSSPPPHGSSPYRSPGTALRRRSQ